MLGKKRCASISHHRRADWNYLERRAGVDRMLNQHRLSCRCEVRLGGHSCSPPSFPNVKAGQLPVAVCIYSVMPLMYVCARACMWYPLVVVVLLLVLQAAGGLGGVGEDGTLGVVLGTAEAIFPQLVALWGRQTSETRR